MASSYSRTQYPKFQGYVYKAVVEPRIALKSDLGSNDSPQHASNEKKQCRKLKVLEDNSRIRFFLRGVHCNFVEKHFITLNTMYGLGDTSYFTNRFLSFQLRIK